MTADRRGSKVHVDADGVRIERLSGVRGGVWLALLAIGAVCALLLAMRTPPSAPPVERPAGVVPPARVAAGDVRVPARPPALPDAPRRPVPINPPVAPPERPPAAAAAPAQPANQGEPPNREDAVFGQANPGERSGIALFPPPGTKPIKRGLLVPDDFELPPGYVRHYQATDDGERVPAILMFHPDYHPVDAHGEPIALPADRVVPPDMAPPGMPIQMLELPEDHGAGAAAP
jgi:hypothetical protein